MTTGRIAYFTKSKSGAFLTIAALGQPLSTGERVDVKGKREANAYCAAHGIKPWNF